MRDFGMSKTTDWMVAKIEAERDIQHFLDQVRFLEESLLSDAGRCALGSDTSLCWIIDAVAYRNFYV